MCADKSMILSISTKIILKCTLNLSSISLKKKTKKLILYVMYPSLKSCIRQFMILFAVKIISN